MLTQTKFEWGMVGIPHFYLHFIGNLLLFVHANIKFTKAVARIADRHS